MSKHVSIWPVRPFGVLMTVGQVGSGLLALGGVVALVMGAVDGDPIDVQGRRGVALVLFVLVNVTCVALDRRQGSRTHAGGGVKAASRLGRAVGMGAVGLGYGLVVAWLAVGLAGGGHGWCSAVDSAASVVLVPGLGVALAYRGRSSGGFLLGWVLVGMVMADASVILAARQEDLAYLAKVWSAAPGMVVLWAVLWVGWQLVAVGAVVQVVRSWRRP